MRVGRTWTRIRLKRVRIVGEVAKFPARVSSLAEIKIQIGRDAAALIMNQRICHLMNLWNHRCAVRARGKMRIRAPE